MAGSGFSTFAGLFLPPFENDDMRKAMELLAKGLPLFAMGSLTLGLAPFAPEPHIWEKIRWISTGQMPSESIYWLDLLMHGAPWVLLVAAIGAKIALRRAPTA